MSGKKNRLLDESAIAASFTLPARDSLNNNGLKIEIPYESRVLAHCFFRNLIEKVSKIQYETDGVDFSRFSLNQRLFKHASDKDKMKILIDTQEEPVALGEKDDE